MKRIESLDALRGIAATFVVFSHIHGVFFLHHTAADVTPLRILWAGGESVILFFVLSGFVLTAPYRLAYVHVTYGKFMLGRIARIYVPYLAALGCAIGLSFLVFEPRAAATNHFLTSRWPHPPDTSLMWQHVLMVGNFRTDTYNDVIWSLVHEMRFAIVFPFFIWALRRYSWERCILITTTLSLGAAAATVAGFNPSLGFKSSYIYSIHYLLFFVAGGLLAIHWQRVQHVVKSLGKNELRWTVFCGLLLFTYSSLVYSFLATTDWTLIAGIMSFVSDWGTGLASCLFIALAAHQPGVSKFLENRLFLFLGKISYSLYLTHLLVLTAALHIASSLSPLLVVVVTFPLIFIIAYCFHKIVEAPAHAMGHRLILRFSGDKIMARD